MPHYTVQTRYNATKPQQQYQQHQYNNHPYNNNGHSHHSNINIMHGVFILLLNTNNRCSMSSYICNLLPLRIIPSAMDIIISNQHSMKQHVTKDPTPTPTIYHHVFQVESATHLPNNMVVKVNLYISTFESADQSKS